MTVVCPNCQYTTLIESNYKTYTNYSKMYICANPKCEMTFRIVYQEKPKNWIGMTEEDFK